MFQTVKGVYVYVCVCKTQSWGWECNSTSLSLFCKMETTVSTSKDFVKVTFHNVCKGTFSYSTNIY